MKVHITLVGKQTLPVFIAALHDAPDKVLLICSDETKESANAIKTKLKQIREEMDVNTHFFDPVNVKEIRKEIRRLKEGLKPLDEVRVNLSGGTKSWSVVFYQMFCALANTTCFYLDQNGYMWDFKSGEAVETTTSNVSFTDLCALHDIEIESLTDISEYDDDDATCLDTIRKMYDKNSYGLSMLTKKMAESGNNYEELEDGNSIERDYRNPNHYSIDLNYYGQEDICCPHADQLLFNTGWFEYLVARLLSRWKQQCEIFLNVKFRLIETGVEINEVDIVVRTKKKYLFVECKTAVYSPTDIDKFNDVAKNYGGIATKRIFIIYKKPDKRKIENFQRFQTVASKCKKLKMPFFIYREIENNTDAFFAQLDKYMAELNE